MLLNLLPGLRDLRTPLAVGYLWLFFAWLVWGPLIPVKAEADGIVARVYDFAGFFGRSVAFAALSFVAYLLGSVLLIQNVPILRRLTSIQVDVLGLQFEISEERTNRETMAELAKMMQDSLKSQLPDYDVVNGRAYVQGKLDQLRSEFPVLVMRLQLHERASLYDSYDRKITESQFRIAIVWPLVAIVVAVAVIHSPWALLAILFPLILVWRGITRGIEARTEVYQAVARGAIKSKVVESLLEEAKTIRTRKGEDGSTIQSREP